MNTHKWQVFFYVYLFTCKEGQMTPVTIGYKTIDNFHEKWKSHEKGINPHFVNHGILTKLSSSVHLYSIFIFYFQFTTVKQATPVSSTKSFIWNVIYILWIVMNTLLYFKWYKTVLDLKNVYCHRMTLIEQHANLSIACYRLTNMIHKGAKCIYLQFNYWKYFE